MPLVVCCFLGVGWGLCRWAVLQRVRSLPLWGRGGVGLMDAAPMFFRLTAVGRDVPLCVRPHGLSPLRWRQFCRGRTATGAGRGRRRRTFRRWWRNGARYPLPCPPPLRTLARPAREGVLRFGKWGRWRFRFFRFARQGVLLGVRRRALWPLRWRRFFRGRAGVGVGRVLYWWTFRC